MAAIYIDSSSLLKILWEEPESRSVRDLIAGEDDIVVSTLAELEVEVQLRAQLLGGSFSAARYGRYRAMLGSLRETMPFSFHDLSGTVFNRAIRQHSSVKWHCRSLDRLHLAAMEALNLRRLLTNDAKQAAVARAMTFEVIVPVPMET